MLSTAHFDIQTQNKTFCQEISTLEHYCGRFDKNKFEMISSRTNDVSVSELYKTDMDASNEDTYGWNYRPTTETVRKFPQLSS